MKALKGFIGLMAFLLLAFIAGGFALPGSWSTERSRILRVPVEEVFPHLENLTLWREWSSMAQVEGTLSEPAAGVGASFAWDDPQWGEGVFRITAVTPLREVRYEVGVEDGSIQTSGHFTLRAGTAGTEVTWREEGDFGWNPLLAYFALGMDRMQGQELEKGLDRLEAILAGG